MIFGVKDSSTLGLDFISSIIPYGGVSTVEEEDVVFYSDLGFSIYARDCVAEGGMVTLISLVSYIGNLMFLGGEVNGLRGSLDGGNENVYRFLPYKKLIFSCLFLLLLLSLKYPLGNMNSAL